MGLSAEGLKAAAQDNPDIALAALWHELPNSLWDRSRFRRANLCPDDEDGAAHEDAYSRCGRG
jgi:hypothetical protein